MKKKKEKQLKEIEKIRKELRYMLEEYLDKKSRRGRKKYTAFIELLQLLKAINLDVMEMEEVNFGSIEICPHIKLDTVQNISICLTIIYTHMNCGINQSSVVISDELNLYLNKFQNLVEDFLFSWWRKDPKSASSEGPYPYYMQFINRISISFFSTLPRNF